MKIRKNISGIVAAVMLLAYLAPIMFKLQNLALTIVILIGIVMMLVDLWQSIQTKNN